MSFKEPARGFLTLGSSNTPCPPTARRTTRPRRRRHEQLAGVDLRHLSHERPVGVAAGVGTPAGTNITVTWQSVPGVNYFLERSTNLTSPFTHLASFIMGQAWNHELRRYQCRWRGAVVLSCGCPALWRQLSVTWESVAAELFLGAHRGLAAVHALGGDTAVVGTTSYGGAQHHCGAGLSLLSGGYCSYRKG